MCRSALGARCQGPEGPLYGMFDSEDVEMKGFTDLPRTVSRRDRISVFRMPTEDLGRVERNTVLTFKAQNNHPTEAKYKVQDVRAEDDGLATKLFLVEIRS